MLRSFLHSLGVVAYIALVATFMRYANRLFGTEDTILTGIAFLLLLCVSAAVVGSLVFGYPVVLFLNGQKKEGIAMAVSTIGWMAVEMIVVLGVLAVVQ
jgi:hypothetical protein